MKGGRVEGCAVAHGWMATGTSFLKEEGGGGGPSGVPQADGTVVRPKDNDTNFCFKSFKQTTSN